MVQLQHLNKKGAPMVVKLLRSAVANAKNNFSMDENHLFIKSITADMGRVMKRYFPRARGSAFVIRRKMVHVNIVLEERKKGLGKKKFSLFRSAEKPQVAGGQNIDQKEETNIKTESDVPKKRDLFKTDEQIKMNKVANKRRLFNRKSGE
jgi:ribosomal protein L22